DDETIRDGPGRGPGGACGVGHRGPGTAKARDPSIQVLAADGHGGAGHDGDVGEPRRGDAHRDVVHRVLLLDGARARADVRPHLCGTRDVHVLLRAASVDAGDSGREMSGTPRGETDMDVSRRGFMQCMAWAGTGVLGTAAGG